MHVQHGFLLPKRSNGEGWCIALLELLTTRIVIGLELLSTIGRQEMRLNRQPDQGGAVHGMAERRGRHRVDRHCRGELRKRRHHELVW
jgi:hypothetical protein